MSIRYERRVPYITYDRGFGPPVVVPTWAYSPGPPPGGPPPKVFSILVLRFAQTTRTENQSPVVGPRKVAVVHTDAGAPSMSTGSKLQVALIVLCSCSS
jgi:hypothetical protein